MARVNDRGKNTETRTLCWELSGEVLTRVQAEQDSERLRGRERDYVTPESIISQHLHARVRLLVTEEDLRVANGPIAVQVRIAEGYSVLEALARLEPGSPESLFPGFTSKTAAAG